MVEDDTAESGNGSELDYMDLKVSKDVDLDMAAAVATADAESPPDGPPEEAKDPKKWKWAVIFLCFYGFVTALKPGESFITPNLLSAEKNFTREQVGHLRLRPHVSYYPLYIRGLVTQWKQ